jgi:hypothetical protein
MVDRVSIGVDDAPADDPVLEEGGVEEEIEEVSVEQPERPEWLPDKFESSEDLARAYGALEKKQSQQSAAAEGLLTPEEFDQYNAEFNEQGSLTEETYATLAKKGLSQELVDSYIQGQNSLNDAVVSDLLSIVGGQETYDQMTGWASDNLPEDELAAYNEAIQGETSTAKLAIRGLYSQFRAGGDGGGDAPNLLQGGRAPTAGGYGSVEEMKTDMKNPLYKAGDINFHAHVEKRLSMTSSEVM